MQETKRKHVYLENSALQLYTDTHYIPPDSRRKIAREIVSHLLRSKKEGKIRILDAGIGHGGDMLIPILEELFLKDRNSLIVVEGFDNSDQQLDSLRSNLTGKGYSCVNSTGGSAEKWKLANGKISLEVYKFDIEKEVNFFATRDNKFDLILCTFLLHHLANWRLGFLKLLHVLKKGGSMIFAERMGDIELLDGNFSTYRRISEEESNEAKKTFYKFLWAYYESKSQHFHWNPEIRATNYSALFNFSAILFGKEDQESCIKKEFLWKYKKKLSDILKWIEDQSYSHFWVGIDKSKGKELVRDVRIDIARYQDSVIELKDGMRITILNAKKSEPSEVNYWMTRPLWRKLEEAIPEQPLKAMEELNSLLITHDFIFPMSTIYLSIHVWNIAKEPENWYNPFSILVNLNAFENQNCAKKMLKNYLLYLKYSQEISFSMLKFMFIDVDKKFPIEVKLSDRLQVKTREDEFGDISKLTIELPNSTKDSIIKRYDKDSLNECFEEGKIELRNLKSDIVVVSIERDRLESINVEFNTNVFDEQIKTELSGLKNYIPNLNDSVVLESLAKAVMGIREFFLKEYGNIYYYPSESIKSKVNEREKRVGFGGFILCEKPSSERLPSDFMNKITENLRKERNKLMKTVCNLFFSRIGILNWANKATYETRKHATRSAVAAIMARNMSHNIGSHVLPRSNVGSIKERLKFG